jgi:membrane associated rhomboid family serine protease
MLPLRDSLQSYSKPYVTIAIIVANAFVFLYQLTLDEFSLNSFIASYGMIPSQLHASTLVTSMFLHGGWLHASSLVTSMFLHGGWLHLIGNMWFLWIFGDNVEDILGHAKYLLFYLLCGVAAALFQAALNMDSRLPTIGASGAIAGVMGAYLVKFPRSRIVTLVFVLFFLTTIEVPASLILIYWFVLQFFSGVGSIASSHLSEGGVAWFAHVGGFLAGILLVFALRPRERFRRREELHW